MTSLTDEWMNDRSYTPERATPPLKKYQYQEFVRDYGDDTELLALLWSWKYAHMKICPVCKKRAKYYHVRRTTQYACSRCAHKITPLQHTIFYRSHVPLSLWFYAIYLLNISKNGISTQKLARTLGVQWRTASNMLQKIRALLADKRYGFLSSKRVWHKHRRSAVPARRHRSDWHSQQRQTQPATVEARATKTLHRRQRIRAGSPAQHH